MTADTTKIGEIYELHPSAKYNYFTPISNRHEINFTSINKQLDKAYEITTTYGRDILDDNHNWSGATLKGKAREYGSFYQGVRSKLLKYIKINLRAIGYTATTNLILSGEGQNRRWRRELVILRDDQES